MASTRDPSRFGHESTIVSGTHDHRDDNRHDQASGGALRRVSWGAIIGGIVVLLVIHLVLSLLGLGIGLSTIEPAAGGTPDAADAGIAGGIWYAIMAIIAAFAGGWVAARLAGVAMRTDGMLHGVLTWATATLILLYVFTSSVGSLVGGTVSLVGSSIQTIAQQAGSAASGITSILPPDIRQQAEGLLRQGGQQAQGAGQQAQQQAQQTTGTASPIDAAQRLVSGVREGASPQDRQAAVDYIAQQAGIPPQEAEQRLTQFQDTYNQYTQRAATESREAAQAASEGLSTAALAAFVAMVLAAIAAIAGGAVGTPRRDQHASTTR